MNPNVSFFMLLGGALISYIEFVRPGLVVPGVVGGVVAMVGLARLISLGLNPEALLVLLSASMVLFVWPALWMPKTGLGLVLGVTPLAVVLRVMVWGGSHLVPGMSESLVWLGVVPFSLITAFLMHQAARARRNKVRA